METKYAELGEHPESQDFKELPPIMRQLSIVTAECRDIADQLSEAARFARADKLDAYEMLADLGLTAYKQWQAFENICERVFAQLEGVYETPQTPQ